MVLLHIRKRQKSRSEIYEYSAQRLDIYAAWWTYRVSGIAHCHGQAFFIHGTHMYFLLLPAFTRTASRL